MKSLTIFSIATDNYLDYWIDLVRSAIKYFDSDISIQWITFTNRAQDIPADIHLHFGNSLLIKHQESLAWPLLTLLRYKLLTSVSDQIKGSIVMYLDADMLLANTVSISDLTDSIGQNSVCFVRHPGYFRPKSLARIKFYICNPIFILKDLKLIVVNGSLGTWERNIQSCAFVPRKKREYYFCGGTWFGYRNKIIEMCQLLSARTEKDLSKEIIAIHHDESHLNWYAVNFSCSIENPAFCFESSYPQLMQITPKIFAINKKINLRV